MQMNTHPVSSEQVMAFLDDQLPAAETKAVAQHLAECWECQVLLADLKGVSGALRSWTIPEPEKELSVPALPARRIRWGWSGWTDWRIVAAATALTVLLGGSLLLKTPRSREAQETAPRDSVSVLKDAAPQTARAFQPSAGLQMAAPSNAPAPAAARKAEARVAEVAGAAGSAAPSPMVVRTAELALTASHFDAARADIERIARNHFGYIADLSAASAAGQPRSLQATLRVPSAQLDGALSDLRRLGHVDNEAQRGEDVTRQFVDVTARIANLREAEQRLTTILRERTGKLSDVLAVEEQIDNTRGQIEMAEAEQKSLSNQVSLATLQLSVSEVYHARLDGNGSVVTRIRNAAVNGIRLLGNTIVGILLRVLTYAPVFLLLAALLFWPVRLAWKRMRT